MRSQNGTTVNTSEDIYRCDENREFAASLTAAGDLYLFETICRYGADASDYAFFDSGDSLMATRDASSVCYALAEFHDDNNDPGLVALMREDETTLAYEDFDIGVEVPRTGDTITFHVSSDEMTRGNITGQSAAALVYARIIEGTYQRACAAARTAGLLS